ncbi:MAG: hypothetical protein HZB34_03630 [Nitrospirae bacterium]|nr:hypothetical protein [Nitrospirota bacterium]
MRTVQEIEQQAERAWARGQLEERERNRRAELSRPPSPNDARLLRPTLVRVLKGFCVQGKLVELGATITLQRHDAESLAALGKVELL